MSGRQSTCVGGTGRESLFENKLGRVREEMANNSCCAFLGMLGSEGPVIIIGAPQHFGCR